MFFFGGLLLSGYGKYTNKRMYWAKEDDVPKILANSIRLNRFELILRSLHLNDNTEINSEDRLYKLRPLIDKLNVNFRKYGGKFEHRRKYDANIMPSSTSKENPLDLVLKTGLCVQIMVTCWTLKSAPENLTTIMSLV